MPVGPDPKSFCLRLDLTYTPWNADIVARWGHAEPALLLQILEMARQEGWSLHAFVTYEFARAFPEGVEAILSEGHVVDGTCATPDDAQQLAGLLKQKGALMKMIAPTGEPFECEGIDTFADAPHPDGWVQTESESRAILAISPAAMIQLDPRLQRLRALVQQEIRSGKPMRTLRDG